MTERGLPIVGAPVACPFVAFEDDRDERGTAPDHRHRCYAEIVPAPRALAHQEAFCLSSAFPVCPTFQDWARREAARARDAGPSRGRGGPTPDDRPAEPPPLIRGRPAEPDPLAYSPDAGIDEDEEPVYEDPRPRRNPQRGWAAPPPWMRRGDPNDAGAAQEHPEQDHAESEDEAALDHEADAGGAGAIGAGGLAGSFADRLASSTGAGSTPHSAPSTPTGPGGTARSGRADADDPTWSPGDRWDDELEPAAEDAGWEAEDRAPTGPPPGAPGRAAAPQRAAAPELGPVPPPPARERHHERVGAPPPEHDERPSVDAARGSGDRHREMGAPSWERPARLEAYPSLRSRRMPSFAAQPILVGVLVLVLAALALFLLPGFLGVGSSKTGASPSPTVVASLAAIESAAPTLAPGATQQTYTVVSGDTMSRIATKFHVPLQALIDANKVAYPNPNNLKVGDVLVIPVVVPTALPGASTSP